MITKVALRDVSSTVLPTISGDTFGVVSSWPYSVVLQSCLFLIYCERYTYLGFCEMISLLVPAF